MFIWLLQVSALAVACLLLYVARPCGFCQSQICSCGSFAWGSLMKPTDLRMGLWRHLLFSVLIQDFTETRSSASRFCIILLQSSGSSCSYFFLNSGSSYRICGTQCHLDLQNGDRCESGIIGLKLKHFNHLSIDISQGTMLIICRHLLVFKDFRHRGTAIRQR